MSCRVQQLTRKTMPPRRKDDSRSALAILMDVDKFVSRIEECLVGVGKDEFFSDIDKRELVLFNLIRCGEALARLRRKWGGDEKLEQRIPGIIYYIDHRNMLVHDYDQEDLTVESWDAINTLLSAHHDVIKKVIAEEQATITAQ